MLEDLLNNQLIDKEGLLLYNYKKLNIDDLQAMIILLVLRMEKNNQSYITPSHIAQFMTIDEKVIDRNVVILMNKQLLSLVNNSISTNPLVNAILKINKNDIVKDEKKKINLVESFEKEFNRVLTPIEIEILKEWKQCHYSDEMILEALKEATLSNVHNMRYIEKILIDWARHGMKRTGRNTISSSEKPIDLIEYEWWNE